MTPTPTAAALISTVGLAAGALDFATLCEQTPEAPPAASVVIEHGSDGDPMIYVQLQHRRSHSDLLSLAEYATLLDTEVTVQVLRVENPVPFVSVALSTDLGGSWLWIWAHPSDEEINALFDAMEEIPDAGTRVEISLDELNEAADVLPAEQDGDQS